MNIKDKLTGAEEEVRGEILGEITAPYEFWTTGNSGWPLYLGPHRFARGSFASDADAEEWLKANYPDEYKAGVEVRVFDR